jgi:replicative DNA helicase
LTVAPLNVLVSYSHKDEVLRGQLATALRGLVRDGLINIWSDHHIRPGEDIDGEIQIQLRKADVVLLLVSSDFIASDYCYSVEMQSSIDRHEDGRCIVIPIIVRYADWTGAPFARLKALPEDAKPVTSWSDRDEAWLSVARGVRQAIELRALPQTAAKPEVRFGLPIRESLRANFAELQGRYEFQSEKRDLEFGLPNLDEATNGISRGQLILAAGRPNSGLLDFSLSAIVWSMLKHKRAAFFASPRQRAQKISQRLLSQIGRVRTHDLERGLLEDEDWSRINLSIKMLSGAKLHLFDELEYGLDEIESAILRHRKLDQVDLVVLDGIEYQWDGNADTALLVVRRLRQIARRHDVAVIANLMIGPHVDNRFDRRPTLQDLNEWHAFDIEADKILFLFRPSIYGLPWVPGPAEGVEVIVAKNGDGPCGTHIFRYFEEYGSVDRPREPETDAV